MKFMFMIYHDENVLDALPKSEMQGLVDSALDYDDEIRRSGHYIVSDALESSRTARTIRVRGGKLSTRTSTRRARSPRGFHRRGSASSKSAR